MAADIQVGAGVHHRDDVQPDEYKRKADDFHCARPLTPAFTRVTAANAPRQVAGSHKDVAIAIVPAVTAINKRCNPENVFRHGGLRIVTGNS